MAKKKGDGVEWSLPMKRQSEDGVTIFMKRPFARSTSASSGLARVLADEGHTFASGADAVLYDDDLKTILTRFVTEGYGDVPMAGWVR